MNTAWAGGRVYAAISRLLFAALLSMGAMAGETLKLRIKLEAQRVAPRGGELEGLHWIIAGTPEFVDAENAAGAAEKLKALLHNAKPRPQCKVQLVIPPHPCYALDVIEGEPEGFSEALVTPPDGFPETPAAPAPPQDFLFIVTFTEIPDTKITAIVAHLVTASCDEKPVACGSGVEISYAEAVRRTQEPAIDILNPAKIRLQYAASDRSRGRRKPPFKSGEVEDALLRIAVNVLKEAHRKGIAIGNSAPTEQALGRLTQGDSAFEFGFGNTAWPTTRARLTRRDAGGGTIITAEADNLRIVSLARIKVNRGRIEDEKGELTSFRGADRDAESEIHKEVEEAERLVNVAFRLDLESLEGSVSDGPTVKRLRDALGRRKELNGPPRVDRFGSVMVFESDKSWVLGKLDAKLSAKAPFTPEDLFTGEGAMTGERLLRNVISRDAGETYSFTLRGGSQLRTAEFVFGFPRSRGEMWVISFGADATFSYARDEDQKIGALTQGVKDRKIRERDKGILPRGYVEARRATESGRWTYLARAEVLFDWRHLLLTPNWDTPSFTDGQLAAPTLRLRQGLRHDRGEEGRGLGSLSAQVQAEGRRGIQAVAGDFEFRQYLVTGIAEGFFGIGTRRDFLTR